MKRAPWHHGRRSIFARLIFILAGAGLLINLLVGAYFRMTARGPMRDLMHRNVGAYLDYAVADMGSPPDPAKARAFSAKSGLELVYEGKGSAFRSSPELLSLAEYRKVCGAGNTAMGWARHSLVFLRDAPGGGFAFLSDPRRHKVENQELLLALLVAAVLLVVAGAGLAIRHMLAPIRDLEAAMLLAGQGNLDARVPPRRQDELGRLAESFNAMAGRLKTLLESRRQLLLGVSHELRTPITRMKLGLESLKDREAAASLGEDLEELGAMVKEILEGESVELGGLRKERVDLAALARQAAQDLAFRKPGIDASGLPAGLEWEADPERLLAALRNVLDNALKYSPEDAPKVELGLALAQGRPQFTVRDHGPGIPEAGRERVFEPFYRLDPSRSRASGGYGLGLSLVRTILRAHGGEASVEAAPGGGTLLRLSL